MAIPLESLSKDSVHGPGLLPADAGADAIARLAARDMNLVSWHRVLPAGLEAQLEQWAKDFPAKFDEVLSMPHGDLSECTHGLAEPARSWLMSDVAALTARLAKLADARRLRVSLGAVRTDQCRKFHFDFVRYRMITTYVGPGTQWLPDEAVNREALEHPENCPCDANKEIVRDADAIRHAIPGEVVLMKGALHPHRLGAVHRSPPIEGTGLVRVVLIVSTVDRS